MDILMLARFPCEEEVLTQVGTIARQLDARVTPLFTYRSPASRKGRSEALARARETLGDAAAEGKLYFGRLVAGMQAAMEEYPYDLVVFNANPRRTFIRRWDAARMHKVIRQAPCPVLVLRGEPRPIRRALVCTGGSPISEPVVDFAAHCIGVMDAEATLLHVSDPIPTMYTGLDEMEETLEELLESDSSISQSLRHQAALIDKQQVSGEMELRHGYVTNTIVQEAEEGSYDLIVLGVSRMYPDLRGMLFTNVTQEVADRAACPVLVVK